MCINPVRLHDGTEVACHKCWQCISRKIDDWTGRCIAESQTSSAVHSVTLTYGRDEHYNAVDHVKAAVLTYSDVQRYIKRFRLFQSEKVPNGFSVRYFVVGEYGTRKGRAHWHILLFWKGRWPYRPLDRNLDDEAWPHGHSFWQIGTPHTVRYVTKYIAKEATSDERQYHMSLSKKPPLGDAYFRQLAQDYIDARLAPQDLFYSFDEARDRNGKKKQYMMQGKTRENFLRYYRDGWQAKYQDHAPNSELLEEWEDKEAKRGSQASAQRILAAEKAKVPGYRNIISPDVFTGEVKKPKDSDLRSWMDPSNVKYDEKLNVYVYQFAGKQAPWFWAMDSQGSYGWRARIGLDALDARNHYSGSNYGQQGRRSV